MEYTSHTHSAEDEQLTVSCGADVEITEVATVEGIGQLPKATLVSIGGQHLQMQP